MGDESVRTLIKTEALKKFDGDFDILYQNIKDRQVGGKTMNAVLNENGSRSGASRKIPIAHLAAQMPLLNISVPVNIEKWNTGSFEPLVVVQSNVKDESKLKLIKAYDKTGKVHWLDAQKAPDFPVIVVGFNERNEIVNGKVTMKEALIFGTEKSGTDTPVVNNVQPIDGGGGSGGGGSGGGGSGGGGCSYADNQWLYLKGMSSPDISQYESWAKGAPEITMRVFAPNNGNFSSIGEICAVHEMEFGSRSDINDNNWWNINQSIVYWNPNTFGSTFVFAFLEIDGGGETQTYTISDSFKKPDGTTFSASATFTYKNDDDLIGTKAIDKCGLAPQGNGTYYDIGSNFNIKLGN